MRQYTAALLIFAFALSCAYATTYTSGSALSSIPGDTPFAIALDTDASMGIILSTPNSSYCVGTAAPVTYSLNSPSWGGSGTSGTIYFPSNGQGNGQSGGNSAGSLNILSSSAFSFYQDLVSKCKYYSNSGNAFACTNNPGYDLCDYNGDTGYCTYSGFGSLANYFRDMTYKYRASSAVNSRTPVAGLCTGRWYVESVDKGEITTPSGSVTIPGLATPGQKTVTARVDYSCIFGALDDYLLSGSPASRKVTWYAGPAQSETRTITLNYTTCECTEHVRFYTTISPTTVTMPQNGSPVTLTLTVWNNGNRPVTISAIAPDIGSIVPGSISPALPVTVQAGGNAPFTFRYMYSGSTQQTVTFYTTGNGTECGSPVTLINTSQLIVYPRCTDYSGVTILASPSTVTLNSNRQAQVALAVTNTGNVAGTYAITSTPGTYSPSLSGIPIAAGATSTNTVTYTHPSGGGSSATFSVGLDATVCGGASHVTNSTSITITSCTDSLGISGTISPASVSFNQTGAHTATVTFTLNNIGTVPATITGITPRYGSFSPSGSYPTIPVGQSRAVSGTYAYSGAANPFTEVFNVSASGTVCTLPATTSININLPILFCTETAPTLTLSISPSTLNPNPATRTAAFNFIIGKSGTQDVTLDRATSSPGTLASNGYSIRGIILTASNPSVSVSDTYAFAGSETSLSFSVNGTAVVCGSTVPVYASATAGGCNERLNISLASPQTITLNSSRSAQVTLTVYNTGNVPATLTSLTAALGTFTYTGSYTISPGFSASVTGTYTYLGSLPATETFTATASGIACSYAATATASNTSTVQGCSGTSGLVIRAVLPNPPYLIPDSQGRGPLRINISNPGNTAITLSRVYASPGYLLDSGGMPGTTIAAGSSIEYDDRYVFSARESTVYLYADGRAMICGASTPYNASTTVPACWDAVNMSSSVLPSPISMVGTSTASLTFTVTNLNLNNPLSLNSITAQFGTVFATLPVAIGAGGTATIPATYTYSGSLLGFTEVFTLSGTGNACGRAGSATNLLNVPVTKCSDSAALSLSVLPQPLSVRQDGRADAYLRASNLGNVDIVLRTLTPSGGTFQPAVSYAGRTINPGAFYDIPGNFTPSPGSTRADFTLAWNATVCGSIIGSTTINGSDVCQASSNLTMSAPPSIFLAALTNSSPVTLTLTNGGSAPVTIYSVSTSSPSLGTFIPTSPSIPFSIAAGSSANVQGTYTYNGAVIPINARFIANGTTTLCGGQSPADAYAISQVFRCSGTASLSLTGPGSAQLSIPARTAQLSFTLTNNGTINMTVTSFTYDAGTYTYTPAMPLFLRPGASTALSGTFQFGGITPVRVNFTAYGNGTVCGSPIPASANTSVLFTTQCIDRASITVAGPSEIVLDRLNSSRIAINVTNTGAGNSFVDLNSITASIGLFVPDAIGMRIPVGSTVSVPGTFTYFGSVPATVAFNASGISPVCGTDFGVSGTVRADIRRGCFDYASKNMTGPSAIVLNTNKQAQVTLNISNNGTVPASITSIISSIGTFAPTGLPVASLLPGATRSISGTFTYNGALPANVIFTESGAASVCGRNGPVGSSTDSILLTNCTEIAQVTVGAPASIGLNQSNSALINISLRNSGTTPTINISAITTSRGTFTPRAGFLPVTIPMGATVNVEGVFFYSGAVPAITVFNATGVAPSCGLTVPARGRSPDVPIDRCKVVAMVLDGYLPSPFKMSGNSGSLRLMISNTGTIDINIYSILPSSNFTYTYTPITIAAGKSGTVSGVITYTGAGDPPSSFTLRVFGATFSEGVLICGPREVNATIGIDNPPLVGQGDLTPEITPEEYLLGIGDPGNANITVSNIGRDSVDLTVMNVTIRNCKPGNVCRKTYELHNIPGLDQSDSYLLQNVLYSCSEGDSYIEIMANVNPAHDVDERSYANNVDTKIVQCSMERCKVYGADLIKTEGVYKYYAECYSNNGTFVNCSDILGGNKFDWTFNVAPPNALFPYPPDLTFGGDNMENTTLTVFNVYGNGTIFINATGKLVGYKKASVVCSYKTILEGNPCIEHI
jgi:hypothetical protein